MSSLIEQKNRWLVEQVAVEFPTPESLSGLKLYQTSLNERRLSEINVADINEAQSDPALEVYLVDFHRLTIMFALEQAKRWQDETDRAYIVEYLTQIILSPEHRLFVAFQNGEPVGAAMVTQVEQGLLVSDLIYQQQTQYEAVLPLIIAVLKNQQHLRSLPEIIWVESD